MRRLILTKKKTHSRLTEALLEMADDQLRSGLMDKAEHEKITIRHLGQQALNTAEPISGKEMAELPPGQIPIRSTSSRETSSPLRS